MYISEEQLQVFFTALVQIIRDIPPLRVESTPHSSLCFVPGDFCQGQKGYSFMIINLFIIKVFLLWSQFFEIYVFLENCPSKFSRLLL